MPVCALAPKDKKKLGIAVGTDLARTHGKHAAVGEVCHHATMRAEVTAAVTDGASTSWFDLDLSWLEWPDIDLGDVFDIFD